MTTNRGQREVLSSPEQYHVNQRRGVVVRTVLTRSGATRESEIKIEARISDCSDSAALFDSSWLRTKDAPEINGRALKKVTIADIFSGCGMMTLGAIEACRALKLRAIPRVAMDNNPNAAAVFKSNFVTSELIPLPIEKVLNRSLGRVASESEMRFCSTMGRIDLLLGGPPCQGHSDLNNYTRRTDPKNALLLRMVRAAELLEPGCVIIENVRGIQHDRGSVVEKATNHLIKMGYYVDSGILKAESLGVAQQRHRFFIVACMDHPIRIGEIAQMYNVESRSFEWATRDLLNIRNQIVLDTPSKASPDNRRRMDYLFRKDLYDLPNSQRPACHRYNSHSYNSVYGRMRWSEPSQTITTGYGSMGQGRFVHPKRARTITPHEAGRLQFIPDHFDFGRQRRGAIAEMIGNAVPPKLTYLIALEALR